MFHLRDSFFTYMQYSYTFSSINVPYSVEEEKALVKRSYMAIKYSLW